MEFLNYITNAHVKNRLVHEIFLILLAPFAPFLTEELWERLGNTGSVFNQSWPGWIDEQTQKKTIQYVVQINGKVRARFEIEAGASQTEIEARIIEDPRVKKWVKGRTIVKKVFVPDKLVNIVVR